MATKAQYQAAQEKLAKIDAAVDDGGVVQAADMARLFPGRPEFHTATTYAHAAEALGLEQDADGEWHVATSPGLSVGDRVEAGSGDDHDAGNIFEIDGDRAFVSWESGVRTWSPIADLALKQ